MKRIKLHYYKQKHHPASFHVIGLCLCCFFGTHIAIQIKLIEIQNKKLYCLYICKSAADVVPMSKQQSITFSIKSTTVHNIFQP